MGLFGMWMDPKGLNVNGGNVIEIEDEEEDDFGNRVEVVFWIRILTDPKREMGVMWSKRVAWGRGWI